MSNLRTSLRRCIKLTTRELTHLFYDLSQSQHMDGIILHIYSISVGKKKARGLHKNVIFMNSQIWSHQWIGPCKSRTTGLVTISNVWKKCKACIAILWCEPSKLAWIIKAYNYIFTFSWSGRGSISTFNNLLERQEMARKS